MATTRSYEDSCGVAHGLDLIGERWALLVIRELMLGPKRFTDLKGDLPGVSANVLTHRLTELESAGILTRHKLPPPAASWVYELTEWGAELEPVLQVLGRWAARSPTHRRDLAFSANSLILSLRTNFDPSLARGVTCDVAIRCGDDAFLACVEDEVLTVERVPPSGADAEIAGDPRMVAAVVYGGRPLGDAIATGDLTVTGNRKTARRFLSLYSLPDTADVAVAS